jgi:hypothetical protein
MTRALLCLLAFHTTALAAQAPSFVGGWQLSYPVGAMVENGEVTVIMGTGTLTIVAQGDSLIGTLVTDSTPGERPRPTVRLAAPAVTGAATFVSHSEATMNINGQESKATVVSTWALKVQGDSLSGTVARTIEGFDMAGGDQPPQPVTGSRKKG